MTIIFFTRSLPSAIANELQRQGHTIHEALALSEVFNLMEQHPNAQIIIAADVQAASAKVIQCHYPTLTLEPEATATNVIWELSHLTARRTVQ